VILTVSTRVEGIHKGAAEYGIIDPLEPGGIGGHMHGGCPRLPVGSHTNHYSFRAIRADLEARAPGVEAALRRLGGTIDEARMSRMYASVKLDGQSETLVAGDFFRTALGIVAFRRPQGQAILGPVGVIQTVPALALLVFMIPVLGIYAPPATAASFLYIVSCRWCGTPMPVLPFLPAKYGI
jgi:hypothetical protein